VSNAVATKKGGKAAKGKPPKAPAAAAGGDAAAAKAKQPADAAGAGKAAAAVDVGTPNPKLFIENLPSATTAAMLEMLFQQFPGVCARRLWLASLQQRNTHVTAFSACLAATCLAAAPHHVRHCPHLRTSGLALF
jgi:hypothetical protein